MSEIEHGHSDECIESETIEPTGEIDTDAFDQVAIHMAACSECGRAFGRRYEYAGLIDYSNDEVRER